MRPGDPVVEDSRLAMKRRADCDGGGQPAENEVDVADVVDREYRPAGTRNVVGPIDGIFRPSALKAAARL